MIHIMNPLIKAIQSHSNRKSSGSEGTAKRYIDMLLERGDFFRSIPVTILSDIEVLSSHDIHVYNSISTSMLSGYLFLALFFLVFFLCLKKIIIQFNASRNPA